MDTLKTDLGGEVFMKNGENGENFYGELVERLAFFTMNTPPPTAYQTAQAIL